MSGAKGQNTKSIEKKALSNTRNPIVGTKNIKFHHQASAGETVIDLTNLVLPSGFTNPSPSIIAKARIKDFAQNLFLISSAKNSLMEGISLGYTIVSNNSIKLNFEAEEGEIFTGLFINATINGTLIADVRTPGATGDLLEGQRDFNLGEAIPIIELSNQWPIQVFRGSDGKPMTRNTGNAPYTGDDSIGNYQMIDNGDGFCSIIKFNIEGGVGNEGILWSSHGALGERPNLSVLQQNENVLGILERMKEDLLEVTGFDSEDPTRYDGAPTNADLKAFGDKVQSILNVEVSTVLEQHLEQAGNSSSFGSGTDLVYRFSSITLSGGAGLFTHLDDAVDGSTFTIIKDCLLTIGWDGNYNSTNNGIFLKRGGVDIVKDSANAGAVNFFSTPSRTFKAKVGEVYTLARGNNSNVAFLSKLSVVGISQTTKKIGELI